MEHTATRFKRTSSLHAIFWGGILVCTGLGSSFSSSSQLQLHADPAASVSQPVVPDPRILNGESSKVAPELYSCTIKAQLNHSVSPVCDCALYWSASFIASSDRNDGLIYRRCSWKQGTIMSFIRKKTNSNIYVQKMGVLICYLWPL